MHHFDKRNPHVLLRLLRHSVASETLVVGLFKIEICHLIDRRKNRPGVATGLGACTEMIPRRAQVGLESLFTPNALALGYWLYGQLAFRAEGFKILVRFRCNR
jgi:hypothetical protein